jgi:hypothetical protein
VSIREEYSEGRAVFAMLGKSYRSRVADVGQRGSCATNGPVAKDDATVLESTAQYLESSTVSGLQLT